MAMKRNRVAGHVWLEPDLPLAKGESSAANSVDERHQREATGVEHLFEGAVTFAQYRLRRTFVEPIKSRNSGANRRT